MKFPLVALFFFFSSSALAHTVPYEPPTTVDEVVTSQQSTVTTTAVSEIATSIAESFEIFTPWAEDLYGGVGGTAFDIDILTSFGLIDLDKMSWIRSRP